MEWTTISHAPNYELRQDGQVRNKKTGKVLKRHINPSGYLIVCLHGSSKGRTFLVHRLIAEQFVSGARDVLHVNHKDGNKQNNAVGNLEWVTRRENMLHRYHVLNSKPIHHKLTEIVVRKIVEYRNTNRASMKDTALEFCINKSMVGAIFSGKSWSHLWPSGKPECLIQNRNRRRPS